MKKIIHAVFFLIVITTFECFCQQGTWTWMKGDSVTNNNGSYGTLGISSPSNKPPAMYEAAFWTDLQGNFWLFGGYHDPPHYLSALWKFEPLTNNWTWMKGSMQSDQSGVYGTQGVASPTNHPGSRCVGIPTWTDAAGDLWMYGGSGFDANGDPGLLGDLWKYHIATNEWTWMKGSDIKQPVTVYGTKLIPAPTNTPGGIEETNCAWVRNGTQLWFFGGNATAGLSADMFMYDIASNNWTWMSGPGTPFYSSVYGTLGVPSPVNNPGSRDVYSHAKDLSGNFWIFGGLKSFSGNASDVWQYNPINNIWTWMNGPNVIDTIGSSGNVCSNSSAFSPTSRFENGSCWTDQAGNFWTFGGNQYNSPKVFNDLWVYRTAQNDWTWVKGNFIANQNGSYGTLGVSSPLNEPPSRNGAAAFMDNECNLWMFGGMLAGFGTFMFNDLWKFI